MKRQFMTISLGDIITILVTILITFLLFSCNCSNGSCEPQRYKADDYNYSGYLDKTISNIKYGDGEAPSGDYLTVSFTDNTYLKIYAYKYTMKIGDSDGYEADKFDFSSFNGLRIQSIIYEKYGGYAGDILHIRVSDIKVLKIYAYKYTMEICK